MVHLADRQDLSVAGKRAGLDGERSGLFMESIRIIKEMRKADKARGRTDEFIRPRYGLLENVPGLLSSNKGEDFRCVLEETARIIQEDAVIPESPKDGWSYSGCIILEGGSIAWKVHDSQWWGVPQRRRRIAVLADFNGYTAPDILLDPQYGREAKRIDADTSVGDIGNRGCRSEVQPLTESVSGNSEPSQQEGQTAAGSAEDGSGETGEYWRYRHGCSEFNCDRLSEYETD